MHGDQSPSYKVQSLKTAICEGRIESVKKILNSRGSCYSDKWKNTSDGYILLRTALQKKHTEIAKLLLRCGVKVNSMHESPCNTPLHFAVLTDDIDFVHMLLYRGANINAKNMHGITPLHNAVESRKMEVINMLLNQGVNVNVADKNSITPLHLAVKNNSKPITTMLLSGGANANGKGNNASGCIAADTGKVCTPLYLAVENGNEELTKMLLSRGANVDAKVNNGKTSLHLATQHGYLEIIEHLLKYRADINSVYTSATHNGYTPLHLAAENGHKEIVKLLLNRGADVNAKGKCGKTSLHLAAQHGYLKIVEHLLTYEADVNSMYVSATWDNCTPLHLAVDNGHKEIVQLLLSQGADVNARDPCRGLTALSCAIERGDIEVVELLLKCGANQHTIIESDCMSPLQLAAQFGRVRIAQLLLKFGATVGSTITHGIGTPLHVATVSGQLEIIKLLLKSGASVDSTDEYGETALHCACVGGDEQIATVLLEHGANVNFMYTSANRDGCTPLHRAADNGHKEIVKLLLSRGADVNANDSFGRKTALYYAIIKGNTDVVELLLKYGANEHIIIDSDFMSPLQLAAQFGQIRIAELLLKFGAEIDTANADGNTAFTYACAGGHEQLVTALLERGADIHIESNYNMLRVALDGIKTFCDIEHCFHEYYHCDSHDIYNYVNIANILKRHMIKMKVANVYAINQYVPSISSDDEEQCDFPNESDEEIARVYYSKKAREERRLARIKFQNECEKEIARMKSEKIGNSVIKFYDILTKDVHQLTIYARNENVVEAIRSDDCRKKFPIYASIINSNFRKGEKRKEFLEQAYKNFHFLYNNFPQLSRSCTERIFFYLDDEDLIDLMNACKPIVYCQQS